MAPAPAALKRLLCAGLCVAAAACSRDFSSAKLGIAWTPPSGIRLLSEDDGPPARAAFSDDVLWYRLDGLAVSLDETKLQETLEAAATAAHAPLDGTLTSSKVGTLSLGPVARYEVHGAGVRELAYLVPTKEGALLLVVRAPDARYGMVSASVERSLSTLRWQ